jgi:hypothetical protein
LVRDADAGEIRSADASLTQRLGDHGLGVGEDLSWLVFNPTGSRKDLFVFLLRNRNELTLSIYDDEPRTRCSLVDGTYKWTHVGSPVSRSVLQ